MWRWVILGLVLVVQAVLLLLEIHIIKRWNMASYYVGIGYVPVRVVDKEKKVTKGWVKKIEVDHIYKNTAINMAEVLRIIVKGNEKVVVPLTEVEKFQVQRISWWFLLWMKRTYF